MKSEASFQRSERLSLALEAALKALPVPAKQYQKKAQFGLLGLAEGDLLRKSGSADPT
jgi:hypothetical protein